MKKNQIEWNFVLFCISCLVVGFIFKLLLVYFVGTEILGSAAIGILIFIACIPLITRLAVSVLDLLAKIAQDFNFVKKAPKKKMTMDDIRILGSIVFTSVILTDIFIVIDLFSGFWAAAILAPIASIIVFFVILRVMEKIKPTW